MHECTRVFSESRYVQMIRQNAVSHQHSIVSQGTQCHSVDRIDVVFVVAADDFIVRTEIEMIILLHGNKPSLQIRPHKPIHYKETFTVLLHKTIKLPREKQVSEVSWKRWRYRWLRKGCLHGTSAIWAVSLVFREVS